MICLEQQFTDESVLEAYVIGLLEWIKYSLFPQALKMAVNMLQKIWYNCVDHEYIRREG